MDSFKIIWVLTEERPKVEVIKIILKQLSKDYALVCNYDEIKIKPIIKNNIFQFSYLIEGIELDSKIRLVEGNAGSFLDYLIFYQKDSPSNDDTPLYVIEETKTTHSESRNVSVFQRLTKFVFIDFFKKLSKSKKIMLYNIKTNHTTIPKTFIFGIRLMKTLNIEILGYDTSNKKYSMFTNIDELISEKNIFATKRSDNTSIKLQKEENDVIITSKLLKNNRLGHDPNIGTVTSLSKIIRILQPDIDRIIIKNHGLTQEMINNTHNKFIKIATQLKITLDGLNIPKADIENDYWKYHKTGEKIVSIMFHLILEYCGVKIIYENHASGEQGYFEFPDGSFNSVKKAINKPDLVFLDDEEKIIYLIEAETSQNVFKPNKGILQLERFTSIEDEYCAKYCSYEFKRYVISFGNLSQNELDNPSILFQLNLNGKIMFSKFCPSQIQKLFSSFNKK